MNLKRAEKFSKKILYGDNYSFPSGVADNTLFDYGPELILALVLAFLYSKLPAYANTLFSNRME